MRQAGGAVAGLEQATSLPAAAIRAPSFRASSNGQAARQRRRVGCGGHGAQARERGYGGVNAWLAGGAETGGGLGERQDTRVTGVVQRLPQPSICGHEMGAEGVGSGDEEAIKFRRMFQA